MAEWMGVHLLSNTLQRGGRWSFSVKEGFIYVDWKSSNLENKGPGLQ